MRIKRSILGAVILFSCLAEANIYIWPVLLKARGELTETQELKLRSNDFPSFGASYSFDRWIVSADRSLYSNESDSGNISIETKYSDFAVWGGYSLFQGEIWDFYGVVGTGIYQQKIETSIGGLSTSNRSSDKSLVGMGAEYLLRATPYFSIVTGAKLNWTQDLEPEIMPELYLKLGAYF